MSEISAIEGVSKIEAIQVNANFIVFDSATINKESNLYRMYESEFTRKGSEDHEERQFVNVYGVDDMKHYLGDETDQGEGVVIDREFADFLNVKLNDSIHILSDSGNRVIELPIVSIVDDEFPIKNTNEGVSSVLMPMKLMEKITGRNTKDRVDIWIDAGAEQNHVKQQLMTIQEISQRGTVTTFNDYAADFYKEQKTKQSLLLIVGVTFLVILLVTCFNAIANNFANRTKETAILYVVGIDKQSIVKAYLQEGLFCIRRGVLFTVLVQSCILLMGKNFFDIDGRTVAIYVLLDLGILAFGLLSTMVFANKLTRNIQLRDLQYE